jgi:hypothetical protein
MNDTNNTPVDRSTDPQPNFLGMNLRERQTHAGLSRDEVAKTAYAIYLAQGRPQGQDRQHWFEAEAEMIEARKLSRQQQLS